MAIQSQFYKDMSKYEPPFIRSLTKRHVKMILQSVPGIILIGIEVFLINGPAFWILSILTATIFIGPPVFIGTGKWIEFRKKVEFSLKYQDRIYRSGQIRRYEKHEFIPKKGVKETDEC